jgi:hypothetical protein
LGLALDDGCQYKRFDGNSDFVLPPLKLKPDWTQSLGISLETPKNWVEFSLGAQKMALRLIPDAKVDRMSVALAVVIAISTPIAFTIGDFWFGVFFAVATVFLLASAYVFPLFFVDSAASVDYSATIARIQAISEHVTALGTFLEKERLRVGETEALINSLKEEKSQLEPLVSTQRATVDAILSTHSRRTAKQAWKERLLGFTLGVFASLSASFIYEYLRR